MSTFRKAIAGWVRLTVVLSYWAAIGGGSLQKSSFFTSVQTQVLKSTRGVTWRHRLRFWCHLGQKLRKTLYFSKNCGSKGPFDQPFELDNRLGWGVTPKIEQPYPYFWGDGGCTVVPSLTHSLTQRISKDLASRIAQRIGHHLYLCKQLLVLCPLVRGQLTLPCCIRIHIECSRSLLQCRQYGIRNCICRG